MRNYIYKNPVDMGYEKIQLTKDEHEKIFKRKPNKMAKEYYKSGNTYRVDYFYPWYVKTGNIILYPVLLIIWTRKLQAIK